MPTILFGATDKCSSCCCEEQVKTFTDRVDGPETVRRGTVYSDDFNAGCLTLLNARAEVLSGLIDDYGTIGGVYFNTAVPCTQITRITVPTKLTVISVVGNRIAVNWEAKDNRCGGRTGIVNLKIRFYVEA